MDFRLLILAFVIVFTAGDQTKSGQFDSYGVDVSNSSLTSLLPAESKTDSPSRDAPIQISNSSNSPPSSSAQTTKDDKSSSSESSTEFAATTTHNIPPSVAESRVNQLSSLVVPETGSWNVTFQDANKTICILLRMEIQYNVTSNDKNGTHTAGFIPKNATASGNCSKEWQFINLEWSNGNSFRIDFTINETAKMFHVSSLSMTLNTSGTNQEFKNTVPELPFTPLQMSYKCDKKQIEILNYTDNEYSVTLMMSHTQIEAFMNKSHADFGEAKDCEGFDTPDIVPIAVGCVLSVLVILVLVAYLIGRKMSHNTGYLSM